MTRLHYKGKETNFGGYLAYKESNVLKFNILTSGTSSVSFQAMQVQGNEVGVQFIGVVRDYILSAIKGQQVVINVEHLIEMAGQLNPVYNKVEVDLTNGKQKAGGYKYALVDEDDGSERMVRLVYPIKVTSSENSFATHKMLRLYVNDFKGNAICLQLRYERGQFTFKAKDIKATLTEQLNQAYSDDVLYNVVPLLKGLVTQPIREKLVFMTFK